jgi:hypothetical protein
MLDRPYQNLYRIFVITASKIQLTAYHKFAMQDTPIRDSLCKSSITYDLLRTKRWLNAGVLVLAQSTMHPPLPPTPLPSPTNM